MGNWKIELFGCTHQGQVRERNEDNYFISSQDALIYGDTPSFQQENRGEERREIVLDQPVFAVVADGMGGHAGGDVASRLVVETLFLDQQCLFSEDPVHAAKELIYAAHQAIIDAAAKDYTLYDMGSTVVSLLFIGDEAIPIHVGDSRVYVYSPAMEPVLQQLTKDHSEMRVLIELGFITPEEAKHHPNRSVILRNLGMRPRHGNFEVEVSEKINICAGDIFLLCSDGLTDMLDDQAIAEIITQWHDDLTGCGRALIQAANDNGGYDNITVILAAVAEAEADSNMVELETDQEALVENVSDTLSQDNNPAMMVENTEEAIASSMEVAPDLVETGSGEEAALSQSTEKFTKPGKPEPQAPFNKRKEANEHETLS